MMRRYAAVRDCAYEPECVVMRSKSCSGQENAAVHFGRIGVKLHEVESTAALSRPPSQTQSPLAILSPQNRWADPCTL